MKAVGLKLLGPKLLNCYCPFLPASKVRQEFFSEDSLDDFSEGEHNYPPIIFQRVKN